MEQTLIEKELGKDGSLKLELVNGDINFTILYSVDGVAGNVGIVISSDVLLDKLAELIPGKVDDAIFNILKAALKV
jgi:hypothetical protein